VADNNNVTNSDYNGLKHQLKNGSDSNGKFSDQDEASFIDQLERELEKVGFRLFSLYFSPGCFSL
jgi:SPX domain protein involved in polyphosphate accumulation